MKKIPDGRVDLVLTDPPYGTTACKWDTIIPFEPMWEQLKRVTKKNGAIVLFGSQPFTSALVMSNPKMFKYEWIFNKTGASNFATAKYNPLKYHENIVVFAKSKTTYNPQMEQREGAGLKRVEIGYKGNKDTVSGEATGIKIGKKDGSYSGELRYPSSVQKINNKNPQDRGQHPTQKPVALMEYLIKTYTNEGETVLDFTMGSGTTGVACKNLNRNFIGIELDKDYFEIAKKRIEIIEEAMNCKNCDGRGDINIGANICWKCKGTGKSLTPTPITNEDNSNPTNSDKRDEDHHREQCEGRY